MTERSDRDIGSLFSRRRAGDIGFRDGIMCQPGDALDSSLAVGLGAVGIGWLGTPQLFRQRRQLPLHLGEGTSLGLRLGSRFLFGQLLDQFVVVRFRKHEKPL